MIDALTETPEFHHWQWDLARQMRDAIEGVYSTTPDEVDAIKALVATVAAGTRVTSAAVAGTSIECESAFLHGPRSQVEFRVGNNTHQRELADLLLLGSYVEDGALRWQRACFVQAKRGSSPGVRSPSRFAVDKWQLALLRAFPPFTGVSGIFQGQSHHLRNRTGMLGAYGLLAEPGDLSLVSARILDQVLGGRGSLPAKELVPAFVGGRTPSEARRVDASAGWCPWWCFDPEHCPECRDLLEHLFHRPWRHWHRHHGFSHRPGGALNWEPPPSVLSCVGLDSVVQSWSSLQLGEVWKPSAVASDAALRACVLSIVSFAHAQTGALTALRELMMAGDNQRLPDQGGHPELSNLAVLSAVARANPGQGE
jgi:hypothetical protein